jgi:RHS repeat-associated protein
MVWMLFDKELKLVKTGQSSGARQIPEGAGQVKQMAESDIVMDQGGFLTAYTVNESPASVYIDNFQLSVVTGNVLEINDYYPFGMLNEGLSDPGLTDPINYYKYNDKELQKELSLEWLDYGARFYDPQIGRFTTVDPKAELDRRVTPYAYVFDNPMRFIDPDGMTGEDPWYIRAAKAVSNFFKGSSTGLNQRYQTEPGRGATVTGIRDTKGGRVSNSTGKPVGEWGVRVDNAHSGTPTPHINVNEKVSGVPDPHTPISATTLKGLENTGKTLDAVDRVAVPVAIATDATRLGVAFHQDGNTIGDNTKITTGSVAGGWAGAVAFGAVGAKIGGGIGTLIEPGGGTVIGGFVGSIIGGVIGSFGGSAAGENIVKTVIEK